MQVRLKPDVNYEPTLINVDIARGYTASIDIGAWLTINTDALPADGAIPIWDGAKFVWSAVLVQFLTPDGFAYEQPGGGYYLSP